MKIKTSSIVSYLSVSRSKEYPNRILGMTNSPFSKHLVTLLMVALLALGVVLRAAADLCSSNQWSQTWGETFTNGGFTWIATNTSPSWLITDTNNYTTWI